MFVRIARWRCRRECWGEDQEKFETGAVPILRAQGGFVDAKLLAEPGGEGRVALTVWSDAASLRRFRESEALRVITGMFGHMYAGGEAPLPEEYEVVASAPSTETV